MTDRQLADRFEAMELPPWHNDKSLHLTVGQLSVFFGSGVARSLSYRRFEKPFWSIPKG